MALNDKSSQTRVSGIAVSRVSVGMRSVTSDSLLFPKRRAVGGLDDERDDGCAGRRGRLDLIGVVDFGSWSVSGTTSTIQNEYQAQITHI